MGEDVGEDAPFLGGQPTSRISLPSRRLRWTHLVPLTFFSVAGGPFGIEEAVKSVGPSATIIGLLLMPLLFALPRALLTAEMSSTVAGNGGSVLWVQRVYGFLPAFINAWNGIFHGLLDLAVYPVMMREYLSYALPSASSSSLLLLQLGGVAIVLFMNAFNARTLSRYALAMAVFVCAPFIIQPFVSVSALRAEPWSAAPPPFSLGVFLSVLQWSYTGWDCVGSFAGEARRPGRSYFRGLFVALALICVMYILPVTVAVSISPARWSLWKTGYLYKLAARVSPTLGLWVLSASLVSALGLMDVDLSSNSRALWAMGHAKMAPSWLAHMSERESPFRAVVAQTVVIVLLMLLPFARLVVLHTVFFNVCLLLQTAAFLSLKFNEPLLERPFAVPGGRTGALLLATPCVAFAFVALLSTDPQELLLAGIVQLLLLLAYFAVKSWHDKQGLSLPGTDWPKDLVAAGWDEK
eukprot:PLAT13634.1.p1 GENE.PLAT13634.1~~PLAT13634.1.p1  ORF type:complete len:466 (-),score=175.66 PLAT13634.1:104-1501(-)